MSTGEELLACGRGSRPQSVGIMGRCREFGSVLAYRVVGFLTADGASARQAFSRSREGRRHRKSHRNGRRHSRLHDAKAVRAAALRLLPEMGEESPQVRRTVLLRPHPRLDLLQQAEGSAAAGPGEEAASGKGSALGRISKSDRSRPLRARGGGALDFSFQILEKPRSDALVVPVDLSPGSENHQRGQPRTPE